MELPDSSEKPMAAEGRPESGMGGTDHIGFDRGCSLLREEERPEAFSAGSVTDRAERR